MPLTQFSHAGPLSVANYKLTAKLWSCAVDLCLFFTFFSISCSSNVEETTDDKRV